MVNSDALAMLLQWNRLFLKQLYPDAYGSNVQINAKTAPKAQTFILPVGNVPIGPSLLNENIFINASCHAPFQDNDKREAFDLLKYLLIRKKGMMGQKIDK